MTSTNEFSDYLESGNPGDHFVYHVGGRLMGSNNPKDVPDVVWRVREAYNQGKIDLVQRRLSRGLKSKFAYCAVKKARISLPKKAYGRDGGEIHLFDILN